MSDNPFSSPPAFHVSVVRLACSACGAEANASCNCGKPYVPKPSERAEQYAKENPSASVRQISEATQVSIGTAYSAKSGVQNRTPETVTGRDGKTYPAKTSERRMPSYIPDPPPPIRDELIEQAVELVRQMTAPERVEFIRLVGGIR